MTVVKIFNELGVFAEDKDIAANIRENRLSPEVQAGKPVCLDFDGVSGVTQSCVHALVSALIRSYGVDAIDRIQFKNCNPTVQAVIEIVIEYSQHGLIDDE